MNESKTIADTLSALLEDPDGLPAVATWSKKRWEEHEATVATKIAEQRGRDRAGFRNAVIRDLAEQGLSGRHVRRLMAGPLDATPALNACAQTEVGIWVLAGNVGCGKTMAAHWWLAGDVVSRRWSELRGVRMVTAAAFARESRYGDKHDKLSRVRRLALDDLGVEYLDAKGSFLTDLDELLDSRWRRELPTLITTNLSKTDFKMRYGTRIADRIRDEGGWFQVGCASMRGGGQ